MGGTVLRIGECRHVAIAEGCFQASRCSKGVGPPVDSRQGPCATFLLTDLAAVKIFHFFISDFRVLGPGTSPIGSYTSYSAVD